MSMWDDVLWRDETEACGVRYRSYISLLIAWLPFELFCVIFNLLVRINGDIEWKFSRDETDHVVESPLAASPAMLPLANRKPRKS